MYRRREGVCLEAPALNQLPRLWTEAGKRDVHLLPLPSAHWPPRGSCARPSPNYCRHHQLSGHLPPLPPPLPPPMPSLPVASLPFILISSFSIFLYTSWYSSLIFFLPIIFLPLFLIILLLITFSPLLPLLLLPPTPLPSSFFLPPTPIPSPISYSFSFFPPFAFTSCPLTRHYQLGQLRVLNDVLNPIPLPMIIIRK